MCTAPWCFVTPPSDERPRPSIHFTAQNGWINDPYGVMWAGDRYHMFFQAIPGRVTWAPGCHWGHAESTDLMHWIERPFALSPQEFEVGCWSGSAVIDTDGVPTLLYTRIVGDDYQHGKVAVAQGDPTWGTWITTADDVVIEGLPASVQARAFRDPFVFHHDGHWVAVLGAGLADGSGAALQYVSRDLRHWRYDGVLCSRLSTRDDGVWTGSLWECPQLVQVDGSWLLLVSVWDDDTLHYVAAAVGDYDGHVFTPGRWQRLTHGNSAYATSTFQDRDGRPCIVSWLREEPTNNPDLSVRAGAHSLVAVLGVTKDGTVSLAPHPNFDALPRMTHGLVEGVTKGSCVVGAGVVDMSVDTTTAATARVVEGDHCRLELAVDPDDACVRVDRPGFGNSLLSVVGVVGVVGRLRVVLDADIVEIFAPGVYGAYRIDPARDPSATTISWSGSASVRVLAT